MSKYKRAVTNNSRQQSISSDTNRVVRHKRNSSKATKTEPASGLVKGLAARGSESVGQTTMAKPDKVSDLLSFEGGPENLLNYHFIEQSQVMS